MYLTFYLRQFSVLKIEIKLFQETKIDEIVQWLRSSFFDFIYFSFFDFILYYTLEKRYISA